MRPNHGPELVIVGDSDPLAVRPEVLATAIPRACVLILTGDCLGAVRNRGFAPAMVAFLASEPVARMCHCGSAARRLAATASRPGNSVTRPSGGNGGSPSRSVGFERFLHVAAALRQLEASAHA